MTSNSLLVSPCPVERELFVDQLLDLLSPFLDATVREQAKAHLLQELANPECFIAQGWTVADVLARGRSFRSDFSQAEAIEVLERIGDSTENAPIGVVLDTIEAYLKGED